jgi:Histidine kinase-like ATPase domain
MKNGAIMPTAVRCVVEADEPVPLVRLVGVLDPAAAESVSATLLTCLADQADALVVDLSGLTIDEPAALSILSAGIDEAAEWAPGQLVLCGSPGGSAASSSGDPVSESVDAALARLSRLDAPCVLGVHLSPVVGAAREARQLVTDGCGRWDLPELVGPACIAVTEMVNNVVAHAQTPMTVRLALGDGALHAAVRDRSPDQPSFRGLVSPDATGGRGLLLIDTLARRWGATALDDGKIVWAVFYPEDEPGD